MYALLKGGDVKMFIRKHHMIFTCTLRHLAYTDCIGVTNRSTKIQKKAFLELKERKITEVELLVNKNKQKLCTWSAQVFKMLYIYRKIANIEKSIWLENLVSSADKNGMIDLGLLYYKPRIKSFG